VTVLTINKLIDCTNGAKILTDVTRVCVTDDAYWVDDVCAGT